LDVKNVVENAAKTPWFFRDDSPMDLPILGSTKPQILRSPLGSWRVVMLCDGLCLQPTSHGLTHWIRRKILTSPWITQDQLWQFSNL